jgi:hypothetical protein
MTSIRPSPSTAKRQRAEAKVIRSVRAEVAARDGFCRLACQGLGPCQGVSEWCHFGASKRFRTRGMAADVRHSTSGSLMLCSRHHRMYDRHEFDLQALTDRLCDGPLDVIRREAS